MEFQTEFGVLRAQCPTVDRVGYENRQRTFGFSGNKVIVGKKLQAVRPGNKVETIGKASESVCEEHML
jgi:hypothetical protein